MVITIIGLGVIGGSYGLALKGKIYGTEINGIDISEETLKKASEMGIIRKSALYGSEESYNIISESDLLIICFIQRKLKSLFKSYKKYFKDGLLITDTTGIKGNFINNILRELPKGVDFVFAHPMAGREKKRY